MKIARYILSGIMVLAQISIADADSDMWSTRVIFNGQAGTTSYGQLDVMQPLVSDNYSLFYVNGSGIYGTDQLRDYSLGFGYRQLMNDSFILGGYSYIDRSTPIGSFNNSFFQVTVGGEVLSPTWDFRANGYLPVIKTTATHDTYYSPIVYSHTVAVHNKHTNIEALSGVDVEAGRAIPNAPGLRAYLGAYHFGFDNAQVAKVNGARVRLEYRLNDTVTLTATEQYDNSQRNQAMLGARITLGGPSSAPNLEDCDSCIEQRMEDMVIRQPAVVTNNVSSYGIKTDPRTYLYVNNAAAANGDGTYEHPYQTVQQALAASKNNDVIYTYQGNSNYDLGGQINLQPGQYFTGSGGDYYYQGVKIFSASGAPVLNGRINVANGDTVSNFTLDGANTGQNTGIYGNGVSNVVISNITVTNFSAAMPNNNQDAYGIELINSANISLNNVNVSNITANNGAVGNSTTVAGSGGAGGAGGNAIGIALDNTQNTSITNTTVANIIAGNGGDGGSVNFTGDNSLGTGGTGGTGGNATGISLNGSTNITMSNINVSNINAGNGGTGGSVTSSGELDQDTGGIGGNGGDAVGINLAGAQKANLSAISINSVVAGNSVGGSVVATGAGGIATGGAAAAGGNATGISLISAQQISANNITVNTITGGASIGGNSSSTTTVNGPATSNGGQSANGGNATAIDLSNVNTLSLNTITVGNITGGASAGGNATVIINGSGTGYATGGNSGNGGNAVGVNTTGGINLNLNLPAFNFVDLTGGNSAGGAASVTGGTSPAITPGTAGNDGIAINVS